MISEAYTQYKETLKQKLYTGHSVVPRFFLTWEVSGYESRWESILSVDCTQRTCCKNPESSHKTHESIGMSYKDRNFTVKRVTLHAHRTYMLTFFWAAKMQFIVATYSAGMSEDDLITWKRNIRINAYTRHVTSYILLTSILDFSCFPTVVSRIHRCISTYAVVKNLNSVSCYYEWKRQRCTVPY